MTVPGPFFRLSAVNVAQVASNLLLAQCIPSVQQHLKLYQPRPMPQLAPCGLPMMSMPLLSLTTLELHGLRLPHWKLDVGCLAPALKVLQVCGCTGPDEDVFWLFLQTLEEAHSQLETVRVVKSAIDCVFLRPQDPKEEIACLAEDDMDCKMPNLQTLIVRPLYVTPGGSTTTFMETMDIYAVPCPELKALMITYQMLLHDVPSIQCFPDLHTALLDSNIFRIQGASDQWIKQVAKLVVKYLQPLIEEVEPGKKQMDLKVIFEEHTPTCVVLQVCLTFYKALPKEFVGFWSLEGAVDDGEGSSMVFFMKRLGDSAH